jgi:hypothetical protein
MFHRSQETGLNRDRLLQPCYVSTPGFRLQSSLSAFIMLGRQLNCCPNMEALELAPGLYAKIISQGENL